MKTVSSKTVHRVVLDEPVVLEEKHIRMGQTDVLWRYRVTEAQVWVDLSLDSANVVLWGIEVGKRGKPLRKANNWTRELPRITSLITKPDGTMETVREDADLMAAVLEHVGLTSIREDASVKADA